MQVIINQKPMELPEGVSLAEALESFGAQPPFAVAVNLGFVHRQDYAHTPLKAGDRVEVVQPVAGG